MNYDNLYLSLFLWITGTLYFIVRLLYMHGANKIFDKIEIRFKLFLLQQLNVKTFTILKHCNCYVNLLISKFRKTQLNEDHI